jgi:hypothetical protein
VMVGNEPGDNRRNEAHGVAQRIDHSH